MSTPLSFARTAFLFCDVQNGILQRFTDRRDAYVATLIRLHRALQEAKRSKEDILVIHLAALARPGHPEIPGRGEYVSFIKKMNLFVEGSPEAKFPEGLEPAETDIVVRKLRIGGFQGTDLQTILQANQIEHVVLFGATTYGVVLSTVVQAVDLDYKVSVIEDCCIEDNPNVNTVLMETGFGRKVNVVKLENVLNALA